MKSHQSLEGQAGNSLRIQEFVLHVYLVFVDRGTKPGKKSRYSSPIRSFHLLQDLIYLVDKLDVSSEAKVK